MQKLKASVVQRMISKQLTSAEVNFITYISHFQDDTGRIVGIYYKDICNALNLSYQGFYDTLHGLVNKEIIYAKKNFHSDWDIEIVGNNFEKFKESYINMGHVIFHKEEFLALKANEKMLAMLFIQYAGANSKIINKENSGKYFIGVAKFYEMYASLFSVSKRIIQRYLHALKQFFSIGIKDKKYFITPLIKVYKKEYDTTDMEYLTEHIKRVACRRDKVDCSKASSSDIQETFKLVKQYEKEMKNKVVDFFLNAFGRSIKIQNEKCKAKKDWKRVIKPKFIHKLMLEEYEQFNVYHF